MSASAYLQGQYLGSLYNQVTAQGELVLEREDDSKFFVILREVDFNPASIVQIEQAEWSHVPQSRLLMDSVQPLIIDKQFQLNEPIMIAEPEFIDPHSAGSFHSLTQTITPQSMMSQTGMEYSLWSKDCALPMVVRLFPNDAGRAKLSIPPNPRANYNMRQSTWLWCFETLLNYNPTKLYGHLFFNVLQENIPLERCQQEIQNFAEHFFGISKKYDLYTQLIARYESQLSTMVSKSIYAEVARNVSQQMQATPQMFLNRTQCLILWLLMPHPSSPDQVDKTWHYVMFTLAFYVRRLRMPNAEEFDAYFAGVSYQFAGIIAGGNPIASVDKPYNRVMTEEERSGNILQRTLPKAESIVSWLSDFCTNNKTQIAAVVGTFTTVAGSAFSSQVASVLGLGSNSILGGIANVAKYATYIFSGMVLVLSIANQFSLINRAIEYWKTNYTEHKDDFQLLSATAKTQFHMNEIQIMTMWGMMMVAKYFKRAYEWIKDFFGWDTGEFWEKFYHVRDHPEEWKSTPTIENPKEKPKQNGKRNREEEEQKPKKDKDGYLF